MARLGVRVVRGANWKWQDQDGGDGYLGTVIELPVTAPKTAVVQWDTKQSMNYRAGYNDRYDLKVYDSGPSGIKHIHPCATCDEREIYGMLWNCCQCANVYLCTPCYMSDRHDINHQFKRYTTPELPPVILPPRKNARKTQAYGIFQDATVKRGKDWIWGDQDGNSNGRVFQVQGWVDESRRSVIRVLWQRTQNSNVYRVGHRGKADLIAVQPTKGWPYYADHLPNYGEELIGQRPPMFALGEKVKIDDNQARVQNLAENHGGWHNNMAGYLAHSGTVHRITDKNDVRVIFDDTQKWTYNPKVLTKIFKSNDRVMVTEDIETLKEFHGDEVPFFSIFCGKQGFVSYAPVDSNLYLVKFNDALQPYTHYIHANCLYLVDNGNAATNVLLDEALVQQTPTVAPPPASLLDLHQQHPLAATTADEEMAYAERMALEMTEDEKLHFCDCIDSGDVDVVRDYLVRFPSLINSEINGQRAAFRAVEADQPDILRLLSFLKVDINHLDQNGDNLIHTIIRKNNPRLLDEVLSIRCWLPLVSSQNSETLTPLHLAAKMGYVECVKILLKVNQPLCNYKSRDGDTPLHLAINFGKDNVIEVIMRAPATFLDPTLTDANGQNALHLACIKGQTRNVETILSKRPELSSVLNKKGFAPLHLAIMHGQDRIVECLLGQGFCNKNARIMRSREFNSYTCLHLAVVKMYHSIVEILVEVGAELDLVDDDKQYTALHFAVEALIQKTCELPPERLLELQQVKPHELNMKNLLRLCGDSVPFAICCYLLGKGADLKKKNKHGFTVLDMLPERMGHFSVVLRSFSFLKSDNQVPRAETSRLTGGGGGGGGGNSRYTNFTEGEKCLLCNEATSNVRFEPCQHVLYCVKCIQVAFGQIKKCSRCKEDIVAKIGPAGEIKPKLSQQTSENSPGGNESTCIVCFEKPKSWMAPKCGHALCKSCCQAVKECPLCRQPMIDLRPVFL